MYLKYLSGNDINLCVQVIHIVGHYTHLAVFVIPKAEATRGIIMHGPRSVDVRPPNQTWARFGAEPGIFVGQSDRLSIPKPRLIEEK